MEEANGVRISGPLSPYAQSILLWPSTFFTLCTLRFTSILLTIHKMVRFRFCTFDFANAVNLIVVLKNSFANLGFLQIPNFDSIVSLNFS